MNKNVCLTLLTIVCCIFSTSGNPFSSQGLSFTENKGQITNQFGQPRPDIQFKVASTGLNIFLSNTGLHYQWTSMKHRESIQASSAKNYSEAPEISINSYRMDVTLLGADPHPVIIKEQLQQEVERYYMTTVAPQNHTVHKYNKITYKNIYPGIDWVLYTGAEHTAAPVLKYDFVVHPGGKINDIKLQFNGASKLAIQEDGSLQAVTPMGHIREKAPYSYIASPSGTHQEIASSFNLDNNILTFSAAPHEGTLVIDPELEWSTYYGGDYWDIGSNTLVDSQGNVYLTGVVTSTVNIATDGAHQTSWTYGGFFAPDGFIAKFTPEGTRIWATYYGGNGSDYAHGAALDVAGNIYLSGYTGSTDAMATPGSFQPAKTGMNDAFLVKFDSSGQRIWGTYYGGPENEWGGFIATDASCNIYMTGYTKSTDVIATPGSFQPVLDGTSEDAFLVKFDSSGQRQWGTYFGGTGQETGNGVTCDASGNVYISGSTKSTAAIATAGSHQATLAGGTDIYLAKFNGSGNLEWATYYGGTEDEATSSVSALHTDATGNVYLAGNTSSNTGIATTGSHQETFSANPDTLAADFEETFLVKFNGAGERQWGTYYGGSGQEWPGAIVVDEYGAILWTGSTRSPENIATPGSIQPAFGGGENADAFVVKLDQDGQRLWGSYLGGAETDEGYGISVDKTGNIYLTGATFGAFPVTEGSHQDSIFAMLSNAYLVKLCGAVLGQQTLINGSDSLCPGASEVYTVTSTEEDVTYIWTLPDGWSGSSDSSSIYLQAGEASGNLSVQIVKCNDTSNVISKEIGIFNTVPAIITIEVFTLRTLYVHESYQWLLNDNVLPGATGDTYNVLENGDYRVVTTDITGCIDTSEIYSVTNYTGIHSNQVTAGQVSIYPNPAQNKLFINSPIPVIITLASIDGRILINSEATKAISLEGISEGIYLLHITDKDGLLIKTEKVIKQ